MRKATLLVLGAALLMISGASAQEYYDYPAVISISGTGTASAEPDIASIVFGVDITMESADMAVDEAGRLADAAMAAARAAGVQGADMHTTGYNLWVEEVWDDYNYEYTGELQYHVTHWIKADVRNMDDVGDVLAAVVDAGANSISSVSFRVEDTAELYELARVRAAEDARNKAEQLADTFGVELGELTSISEWTNNYYPMDGSMYNYGGGYGEYYAPPISPGSYTISVEVSASWELAE